MLLPEDLVVWDNELTLDDKREVGDELASLGELSKNVETLPNIVLPRNAYVKFLENKGLATKIKHLLGTLNHSRHESLQQVSKNINKILQSSEIPEEIHQKVHKMLFQLPSRKFVVRVYYFEKETLLKIYEETDVVGDAVVMEKIRKAWSGLYASEYLEKFYIHKDNYYKHFTVIAIFPLLDFSLTGYVKHSSKNEYEIEAHTMTRYKYNKSSKKIEHAVVLPGGDKNCLTAYEIKKILHIGKIAEDEFYTPHTVFWGRFKDEIIVTKVMQNAQESHENSFNNLITAVTVHPGITIGRLRVVDVKESNVLEFNNEILMIDRIDKKMVKTLNNVKGVILNEDPLPEVGNYLKEQGIPTIVRKGGSILYSTGDVVSLNATTGEIKRGSLLVS